jgi:hypothetical protein
MKRIKKIVVVVESFFNHNIDFRPGTASKRIKELVAHLNQALLGVIAA